MWMNAVPSSAAIALAINGTPRYKAIKISGTYSTNDTIVGYVMIEREMAFSSIFSTARSVAWPTNVFRKKRNWYK